MYLCSASRTNSRRILPSSLTKVSKWGTSPGVQWPAPCNEICAPGSCTSCRFGGLISPFSFLRLATFVILALNLPLKWRLMVRSRCRTVFGQETVRCSTQERNDARMDYLVCTDVFRRGSHGVGWRPSRRFSENGRAIILCSLLVGAVYPLCPRRRKVTVRRHV
jgi:hypothetical protein